ncbi:hypothetical protein DHD05_15190 [Arenibacter sp. N53]|uniref:hypothetical protein n=1 Tax=Arenibacter TaxID=178469 RepID=UPI000CD3C82A|nr:MULTISPECIES: hypothetical protein [Arenibacter]MCM4152935.1 hypothetical protein [Arenibacter sp. N53]
MAKILNVDMLAIPNVINVGDDVNDITVVTRVKFHPLDIKLEMPYCLHLFVYDIHGHVDVPLVLPNWDESQVLAVAMDRKDDFLGKEVVMLTASEEEIIVETPMALQLGQFNREMSYTSRKIKVFATMAPIVGRASRYSELFSARLSY